MPLTGLLNNVHNNGTQYSRPLIGPQAPLEIYVRTYVLGLPRRKVCEVQKVLDEQLLQGGNIPSHTGLLIRDLVRFRIPSGHGTNSLNKSAGSSKSPSTVNLPSLLHNIIPTVHPKNMASKKYDNMRDILQCR